MRPPAILADFVYILIWTVLDNLLPIAGLPSILGAELISPTGRRHGVVQRLQQGFLSVLDMVPWWHCLAV